MRTRFWTDKIADGDEGKIAAKLMGDSGVVRISLNKTHASASQGGAGSDPVRAPLWSAQLPVSAGEVAGHTA